MTWDQDDNIYVSDGYVNSRIAKLDKNGDWIKSWGKYGKGGKNADENPFNIDIRTTCRPIGLEKSMLPIAATVAFRCSIATATSSTSCS